MLYNHITELIGNTPLLKISPEVHGLKNIELYAKLEMYNPFGSLKDRIAWEMIKDDLPAIKSKKQTILESSSGNTAKALQALAGVYGIQFKTITNRVKVQEVKQLLQLMGAEIEELPGRSECPDPTDPHEPLKYIENEISRNKDKYFYTSQYTNAKNLEAHYKNTGAEILNDLKNVDYFVATLGTTGSSRGAAEKLKETNPNLVTVGVAGTKGDYIPGIRNFDELWEVGLFKKDFYSDIAFIDSGKAIDGMLELVRRAGVLCGPTSGACYQAAIEYLKNIDGRLKEKKTAVFIVCDRLEWYVSYIKERRPELFGQMTSPDSFKKINPDTVEAAPQLSLDQADKCIVDHRPLIIDIRGNIAYRAAHIPSSINIPAEQLEKIIDQAKPFPKGTEILIVCPVGEQSKKYVAYLKQKGYTAHSLESGITGWRDAGKKLESLI